MNITERILTGQYLVPKAFVHLGLTGKCPARCTKCNVWKHPPTHKAVSWKTWVDVTRQLDELYEDSQVTFSGGEPLLLEGIYDLIEGTRSCNNVFTVLNTGAYFIDDWMADRLCEAGAKIFGVSLDGLEQVNDRIRGVPGAYAMAMAAIDRIKASIPEAVIGLVFLLAAPSLSDAVEFVKRFGEDSRIREVRFQPVFPPLGDPFRVDWYRGHPLWPDPAQASEVIDQLIALKESGLPIQNPLPKLEEIREYFTKPEQRREGNPCPAGDSVWVVDDQGEMFFCPYHDSVGNVQEGRIKDILQSERAKKAREKILTCPISYCHLSTNGGA